MDLSNISEIKTIHYEFTRKFDPELNELLKDGWVILKIGTLNRGKNDYDHFLLQ